MTQVTDLFDLEQTEHAALFEGVDYGWDILPLIAEYLQARKGDFVIQADIAETAVVGDGVHIGEGTVIEPGVVIHGPAIIGKNCVLRTGAYIRGNVIIGDDCIIGNSTEIKNSVLFNNVTVPHFNYVGDSVLGYKVHVGSSVVLSNVKTPRSEITVVTPEETINTGLEKFGALIGDHCEIGANAVLNPGTIVGRNALIYPLALIRGVVDANTIVKVRQQQEVVAKRVE